MKATVLVVIVGIILSVFFLAWCAHADSMLNWSFYVVGAFLTITAVVFMPRGERQATRGRKNLAAIAMGFALVISLIVTHNAYGTLPPEQTLFIALYAYFALEVMLWNRQSKPTAKVNP